MTGVEYFGSEIRLKHVGMVSVVGNAISNGYELMIESILGSAILFLQYSVPTGDAYFILNGSLDTCYVIDVSHHSKVHVQLLAISLKFCLFIEISKKSDMIG